VTAALELRDVDKSFGSTPALVGAMLRVRPGSVHALLGENGAGKSTLMHIAYGLLQPDRGSIVIAGRVVRFRSPADAIAAGIGMVHQHFALVRPMSVAENLSLGLRGLYDRRRAFQRVQAIEQRTGLRLDPAAQVSDLPVGAQQRVEIAKALARDAGILILDEPTAVLAPPEAAELLAWIRDFRSAGHAVILITHKLQEAAAVADEVTVLRRGVVALSAPAGAVDETALVVAMLGRQPRPRQGARMQSSVGAVVLGARGVQLAASAGVAPLRGADLEVRSGEIVGIAAMEGAGQHELLRILAGRLVPDAGEVRHPADVAFVPEDRQRDALIAGMSLTQNVALRKLGERSGRVSWSAVEQQTARLLRDFDVRASGPDARAGQLSGGNQQRLVLARELASNPPAIVAENPTRGLDVPATESVHQLLRREAARGAGVLLYSSDLDEVLGVADRVVVMREGRVHPVGMDREEVGRAMLGVP
jgi:general nucleoside transport system ATP-binding protein